MTLKPLTDDIVETMESHCLSIVSASAMARLVGEPMTNVAAAFKALDVARRARMLRRGQGKGTLYLASNNHAVPICCVCHREFERPKKSVRLTCSRACHASLGWGGAVRKAKRIGAIKAQRQTPQGKANSRARNLKRWSDPKQRERASEQNRKRWADPVMKAKMSAAIRNAQRKPEQRALYSAVRKAYWDDPKKRDKMLAGIRKSKSTPEARAKFSKLLKDRWADPVMRAKYTAANKARNEENRAASSARLKALHQDPVFKAKQSAWMKVPGAKRAASIKGYKTRRINAAAREART